MSVETRHKRKVSQLGAGKTELGQPRMVLDQVKFLFSFHFILFRFEFFMLRDLGFYTFVYVIFYMFDVDCL